MLWVQCIRVALLGSSEVVQARAHSPGRCLGILAKERPEEIREPESYVNR
jgi:hypothetical protein